MRQYESDNSPYRTMSHIKDLHHTAWVASTVLLNCACDIGVIECAGGARERTKCLKGEPCTGGVWKVGSIACAFAAGHGIQNQFDSA